MMFNASKPDASELPTTSKLLKSTGIAAVIASVLLVTTVLPAEYGMDPTGVGSVLGLTEMGRIKMSLAAEAKAEADANAAIAGPGAPAIESPAAALLDEQAPAPAAPGPAAASSTPVATPAAPAAPAPAVASDETTFTLAPDEGFEIKLVMKKGAKATFTWFTDGPGVNYDTHGDGAGISYHGYAKGTDTPRLEGELVAAFDGSHGWFWRNRTDDDVTVTLKTSGDYSELKMIE